MTNYFEELDIFYLEKLFERGNYVLTFSRNNSHVENVELRIFKSGKFIIKIIGHSISHTLKRADAFLRDSSVSMPLISEYVSTKLDNLIIISDFIIEILKTDSLIFNGYLYNSDKELSFAAIDFNLCNVLSKLEEMA